MLDPEAIGEALEAASTPETARATGKQVHTIRGVRGVPVGEVARITAQTWASSKPQLPRDEDALSDLFGSAWEDGLVAVGLLAACTPDKPREALEVALDWCERLDDVATADALGWLVIGPAALASRADVADLLDPLRRHAHAAVRRAGVMAGMAMTPSRLEGPSAAALRERLGTRDVAFVEDALSSALARVADAFLRDEDASVRKALRRVLGAWAASDPDAAEEWLAGVQGGVPKMLREEIERLAKKARRQAAAAAAHRDEGADGDEGDDEGDDDADGDEGEA